LDQCSQESRVAFLDYFSGLSDRCEGTFKVVITTRNPQLLQGEIHDSLELNADSYAAALDSDSVLEQAKVQLLAPLGGSSAHKGRLEGVLKKLSPLDKGIATKLRFAQDHSEWPANPSFDSLNQFTGFIASVSPDDTPEETLDKTLRSLSEDEEFRWMLGWVISGYRPLSLEELSDLLRCHRGEGNWPASTSFKRTLTTGYSRQLKSWLRMLATFKDNRVTLRDEVRDIFDSDLETKSFTWTEVRRTAHQAIVEFCLTYLISAEAQSSLESLFSRHLTRIGSGGHHPLRPTISIDADGEGILFYIIQALPFHLSRCPPTERTGALKRLLANPEDNPYTRWAEVYWAMSNPFSRTSESPKSPLPILVGLDMLSYEDVKKAPLNVRQQCIVAAASSQNSASMVAGYLRDGSASLDMPFLMSVLLAAVRGHNEQVALEVVAGIASLLEGNKTAIEWPESAIWAATWLDMDRFATAILSRGASPDPLDNPSTTPELTMTYLPGPLYLACSFGRGAIVKALTDHGASHHQLRNKSVGCLQAAASRGFAGVAKLLVEKDHSLLEARLPCSGLYSASSFGSYKVVEALLELGADPDPGQSDTGGPDDPESRWNPLVIACRSSYPRVVELLLRYKANPNCIGPYGLDTPLWYAAVQDPDPECVRMLLEHGADPNHELLSPPLIMEVESSRNDENVILEVCRVLRTVGEQPIDVQAAEPLGRTALMRTAYRGRMDLLRWLLDNGADINALDSYEECALHFAADAGQVEAARELVRRGARLDIGRSSVLMSAIDHPEVFRLLLDAGSNPDAEDSNGNSLINLAVVGRKVDVVKMLIEKKANINHPDSSGWPPVFDAAVYINDASLTRLLADGGADLTGTVNGLGLLHHAVVGPPEIMKILLEFTRYLKLDTRDIHGNTALVGGSMNSRANFECLKSLVYAGADVNAKDRDGETALHNAVRSENDKLLSLLLAQPETDINWAGSYGTALQQACQSRMITTVRTLLDKGAHINQVTPKSINSTPLVAALRSFRAQRDQDSEQIDRLVRELVARGADVRQAVPGNMFYTALSAACLGSGVGTINFLLDEGAAADLADPVFGRLPLHFAAMNGLENLRTMLLAFRGSLLHSDGAGKTTLHWAAQFGNAYAVRFILASKAIGEGAARARYVNQRDEQGWTPLCWAARQLELTWVGGMRSETADHAAVVRVLLENGADADIECRLGNGETTETLTILDLARRSAGDDVIGALTKHLEQRRPTDIGTGGDPARRYEVNSTSCDICLSVSPLSLPPLLTALLPSLPPSYCFVPARSPPFIQTILGYRYHCISCPDYDVCTTCLPAISKYHNGEVCEDGLPHAFERKDGVEYQDPPAEPDGEGDADAAPPSTRPSSPGGVEPSGVPDNEEGAEEAVLNDLEADLALEDEEEAQEAR
jgi:ankyrin repeat protein